MIPEPTTDLWLWLRKFFDTNIWPATDEDAAQRMGDNWHKVSVGMQDTVEAATTANQKVALSWKDSAGVLYTRNIEASVKDGYGPAVQSYQQMAEMCWELGRTVAQIKDQIYSELAWNALFFAATFALPPGIGDLARWKLVASLANRFSGMIRAAAGLVETAGGTLPKVLGKLTAEAFREGLEEIGTELTAQKIDQLRGFRPGGIDWKQVAVAGTAGVGGSLIAPGLNPIGRIGSAPANRVARALDLGDRGTKVLEQSGHAFFVNGVSSPISSVAAQSIVDGNWANLVNLQGYGEAIVNGGLTAGTLGASRIVSVHAGDAAGQYVSGQLRTALGMEQYVAPGTPPGGGPNGPTVATPGATDTGSVQTAGQGPAGTATSGGTSVTGSGSGSSSGSGSGSIGGSGSGSLAGGGHGGHAGGGSHSGFTDQHTNEPVRHAPDSRQTDVQDQQDGRRHDVAEVEQDTSQETSELQNEQDIAENQVATDPGQAPGSVADGPPSDGPPSGKNTAAGHGTADSAAGSPGTDQAADAPVHTAANQAGGVQTTAGIEQSTVAQTTAQQATGPAAARHTAAGPAAGAPQDGRDSQQVEDTKDETAEVVAEGPVLAEQDAIAPEVPGAAETQESGSEVSTEDTDAAAVDLVVGPDGALMLAAPAEPAAKLTLRESVREFGKGFAEAMNFSDPHARLRGPADGNASKLGDFVADGPVRDHAEVWSRVIEALNFPGLRVFADVASIAVDGGTVVVTPLVGDPIVVKFAVGRVADGHPAEFTLTGQDEHAVVRISEQIKDADIGRAVVHELRELTHGAGARTTGTAAFEAHEQGRLGELLLLHDEASRAVTDVEARRAAYAAKMQEVLVETGLGRSNDEQRLASLGDQDQVAVRRALAFAADPMATPVPVAEVVVTEADLAAGSLEQAAQRELVARMNELGPDGRPTPAAQELRAAYYKVGQGNNLAVVPRRPSGEIAAEDRTFTAQNGTEVVEVKLPYVALRKGVLELVEVVEGTKLGTVQLGVGDPLLGITPEELAALQSLVNDLADSGGRPQAGSDPGGTLGEEAARLIKPWLLARHPGERLFRIVTEVGGAGTFDQIYVRVAPDSGNVLGLVILEAKNPAADLGSRLDQGRLNRYQQGHREYVRSILHELQAVARGDLAAVLDTSNLEEVVVSPAEYAAAVAEEKATTAARAALAFRGEYALKVATAQARRSQQLNVLAGKNLASSDKVLKDLIRNNGERWGQSIIETFYATTFARFDGAMAAEAARQAAEEAVSTAAAAEEAAAYAAAHPDNSKAATKAAAAVAAAAGAAARLEAAPNAVAFAQDHDAAYQAVYDAAYQEAMDSLPPGLTAVATGDLVPIATNPPIDTAFDVGGLLTWAMNAGELEYFTVRADVDRSADPHRVAGMTITEYSMAPDGNAAELGQFVADGPVQDHGALLARIVSELRGSGFAEIVDVAAVTVSDDGTTVTVRTHPDQHGRPGPVFSIRLEVGPVAGRHPAALWLDSDRAFTVRVSERIRSGDVARAIAHEVREISRLVSGSPDGFTAHEHGRLAELRTLHQEALQEVGAEAAVRRAAYAAKMREVIADIGLDRVGSEQRVDRLADRVAVRSALEFAQQTVPTTGPADQPTAPINRHRSPTEANADPPTTPIPVDQPTVEFVRGEAASLLFLDGARRFVQAVEQVEYLAMTAMGDPRVLAAAGIAQVVPVGADRYRVVPVQGTPFEVIVRAAKLADGVAGEFVAYLNGGGPATMTVSSRAPDAIVERIVANLLHQLSRAAEPVVPNVLEPGSEVKRPSRLSREDGGRLAEARLLNDRLAETPVYHAVRRMNLRNAMRALLESMAIVSGQDQARFRRASLPRSDAPMIERHLRGWSKKDDRVRLRVYLAKELTFSALPPALGASAAIAIVSGNVLLALGLGVPALAAAAANAFGQRWLDGSKKEVKAEATKERLGEVRKRLPSLRTAIEADPYGVAGEPLGPIGKASIVPARWRYVVKAAIPAVAAIGTALALSPLGVPTAGVIIAYSAMAVVKPFTERYLDSRKAESSIRRAVELEIRHALDPTSYRYQLLEAIDVLRRRINGELAVAGAERADRRLPLLGPDELIGTELADQVPTFARRFVATPPDPRELDPTPLSQQLSTYAEVLIFGAIAGAAGGVTAGVVEAKIQALTDLTDANVADYHLRATSHQQTAELHAVFAEVLDQLNELADLADRLRAGEALPDRLADRAMDGLRARLTEPDGQLGSPPAGEVPAWAHALHLAGPLVTAGTVALIDGMLGLDPAAFAAAMATAGVQALGIPAMKWWVEHQMARNSEHSKVAGNKQAVDRAQLADQLTALRFVLDRIGRDANAAVESVGPTVESAVPNAELTAFTDRVRAAVRAARLAVVPVQARHAAEPVEPRYGFQERQDLHLLLDEIEQQADLVDELSTTVDAENRLAEAGRRLEELLTANAVHPDVRVRLPGLDTVDPANGQRVVGDPLTRAKELAAEAWRRMVAEPKGAQPASQRAIALGRVRHALDTLEYQLGLAEGGGRQAGVKLALTEVRLTLESFKLLQRKAWVAGDVLPDFKELRQYVADRLLALDPDALAAAKTRELPLAAPHQPTVELPAVAEPETAPVRRYVPQPVADANDVSRLVPPGAPYDADLLHRVEQQLERWAAAGYQVDLMFRVEGGVLTAEVSFSDSERSVHLRRQPLEELARTLARTPMPSTAGAQTEAQRLAAAAEYQAGLQRALARAREQARRNQSGEAGP